MQRYSDYQTAEDALLRRIISYPDFMTKTTHERICEGFILTRPKENRNDHSNYEYADEFFKWMMSGDKALSRKLHELNPWVERFVTDKGLPQSFSASYGWKIKDQMQIILDELKRNRETRRAYVNILYPEDHVILPAKTTHEYPCTVGFQCFIRHEELIMVVNIRSNNCYAVMPYDVYNMTMLQQWIAEFFNIQVGHYYHQINNAHIYSGDVRRVKEKTFSHSKTKTDGSQSHY